MLLLNVLSGEDNRLIVVDLGKRRTRVQPTIHLHGQGSGNSIIALWVPVCECGHVCVCEVGIEGVPSVLLLINGVFCRRVCFGKCIYGREVTFCTIAGPSPFILLPMSLNKGK